ncbi:MAG: hypothetical protein A2539_05575 [Elusimicrobia bacterium RIFOXYD2_FULL_34_15]|nr:MAG: hypothetical protein A2539_05575 [Elusimicrobia bacterium RIFOXYD2_FULL_34_15]
MNENKSKELNFNELINVCNPDLFNFETTKDLSIKEELIGQERALRSVDFGISIKSEGYNIYVSGISGTGRKTMVMKELKQIAEAESVPEDICYLYNFEKKDEPKAIKIPAGIGCQFQKDMEDLIIDIESEIKKIFSSEEYEKNRKQIITKFEQQKDALFHEVEEIAKQKGLTLEQTPFGFVTIPLVNNHAANEKDFEKFSDEKKSEIKHNQKEVYDKYDEFSKKIKNLEKEAKKEIQSLDEKISIYAIGHLLDDLRKKYEKHEKIVKHLNDIQQDIIKNLDIFKKEEEQPSLSFLPTLSLREVLNKYKVNLLVDNCNTKGAPIVYVDNPTYHNIMGKVEYKAMFGVLLTDFLMIKPGTSHIANGGYMVIEAMEIFKNPFAWDTLKRIMKNNQIKIEDISEKYGLLSASGLKPEPIQVNFKVIIIGDPQIYHILNIYDNEFSKLFKVKVDFDTNIKRNDSSVLQYANYIANKCREENLLPFTKYAVANMVELGSRFTEHKGKLTTRFLKITDMLREANYWAKKTGSKVIDSEHVKRAIGEKIFRSNMIEEKIGEFIEENTLFIDVKGSVVGQINGISVLDIGDYAFGKPSRITATTFFGKGEITNIEREVKLSGKIHSKGILILHGYLAEKFGQNVPLSFSASIGFEQLYDEIEGDSASSAELYCLISSLSELPLRQDIAVTGSVNQKGMVQPIGAVNEKIEGFYKTCKSLGLTGTQGVMIPDSNVKHLMLNDEVVNAVKNSKFHIYSVSTIEQGIELLTGLIAGEKDIDGKYPEGTIYYKIYEKLTQYANLESKFGKNAETNIKNGKVIYA